MSNNYIFYKEDKEGYTSLVDERQKLIKRIKMSYLKLNTQTKYCVHPSQIYESVLVLLKGSFFISFDGKSFERIGPRADMFTSKPWAVYIPLGMGVEIRADSDAEAVLSSVRAEKTLTPLIIKPEHINVRNVGKGAYSRHVYDIMGADSPADRILIGETINPEGNWSSYPPHKHDCDKEEEETKLEEVYYFRLKPENGFGFQRIYNPEYSLDEALVIKNHSVVLIPKGYHPVSAPPGISIYYLWVLAGERRIMKPCEDAQFSWINSK